MNPLQNCRLVGFNVDSEAYHRQDAERGTPEFAMSPSSLKAFLECPARWKAGYNSPDSDAKDWGNLVDCLALTPAAFKDRYAVKPETYPAPSDHARVKKGEIKAGDPLPWNANAKICEAWESDVEKRGLEPLSARVAKEATIAASCLVDDEKIRSFLEASDRQALIVGEWVDDDRGGTGLVIPVRCLIDLAPWKESEFSDCLGDLKTGRSAGVIAFGKFAFQMGYHIQAAFDLDLWNAAHGENRTTWCFIVQESYPPYQTGRRIFSQEAIECGRRKYTAALELYAKCLKSGVWPGYDDTDEAAQGWSVIHPPPWLEGDEAFKPKFEITDDENRTRRKRNAVMTPEEKELSVAGYRAWLDGKPVEFNNDGEWLEIESNDQINRRDHLRPKPEPRLRPWKTSEVPVGALIRVKTWQRGDWVMITGVRVGHLEASDLSWAFDRALVNCEWKRPDETDIETKPCGILETP